MVIRINDIDPFHNKNIIYDLFIVYKAIFILESWIAYNKTIRECPSLCRQHKAKRACANKDSASALSLLSYIYYRHITDEKR